MTKQPTPHFLGPRIKRLRRHRGLTQDELAQSAGVTQSLISQLERGERLLSPKMQTAIARVLETDPSELTSPVEPDDLVRELLQTWSAYRGARQSYEWLARKATKLSHFVEFLDRQPTLRKALPGVGKRLEDLAPEQYGDKFRERVAQDTPERIEERTELRIVTAEILVSQERVRVLEEILQLAPGMSTADLTLLKDLARRLGEIHSDRSTR